MEEIFEENFTQIYKRNADRIYRMCYVYLKNSADAEDAVSAVFLKFLRTGAADGFNDLEHEKAWFLRAAKNYCCDVLKSAWHKRRVDIEKLPETAAGATAADHAEPHVGISGCADTGSVLSALLALPEKYRIVLYMFYIEGYSAGETAEILGRSESTVRTQLQRGREKLKNDLKEHFRGNDHE